MKKIYLPVVLFILTSCTFNGEKDDSKQKNLHSMVGKNKIEIKIPNNCVLYHLDYSIPSFAELLCSYEKGSSIVVGVSDLIEEDLRKSNLILDVMINKIKINEYECGNVIYKLYSCYSNKTGALINSEDKGFLEYFVRYQNSIN